MIDHDSPVSLYAQLAETLEKKIFDGEYKPGSKLPSEGTLCRDYRVSRITVRQALNLLIQKDLVYSVHGKGTFVKIPEINHELSKIIRFGTALQRRGLNGFTKVHSFEPAAKNDEAYARLQCDLCNLNLVGYAQDTPIVYYQSYVRSELGKDTYVAAKSLELQHVAFSSYDLYDTMGIKLHRVEQTIGAVNANKELSDVFHITGSTALIRLESVYFDAADAPLEYKIGFYRSDIYSFHLFRELN